jgi:hypothetical protein
MAEKTVDFKIHEPLRTNRWILNVGKVPAYLFRTVNLETFVEKGQKNPKTYTKLTFSIYNTVNYTLNPDEVITLKKIKLDFLDPVGTVVNGYDMNVEFEKMALKCDYADGGLLTHEFVFYVKNLDKLYSNQGEDSEKEIIEKYKKNKKKKEKESV